MARVTVYLRTSLFTLKGEHAHLPAGAMVLEGDELEGASGGLRLQVDAARDERGRDLGPVAVTLRLPWAKIDHVVEATD